ncbi:MAG: hypothetical protein JJU13_12560 [Balneolaceae bacterium]|nr:hypothetical protein [Balneolaceae bacterium]
MENEIEIAQLVHHFVRGGLSDEELDKLFAYLHEDQSLLEYIMLDTLVYRIGLQKKRKINSFI